MRIIFFDTETTGNQPQDVLCQIAWMEKGGELKAGLFKPSFPIPPEASAVHHISNKMVEGKPAFQESAEYSVIKELFESDDVIVVAHNAKFDLAMLTKENIVPKHHICTLRVARAMDPEGKLPKYSLQYLRYALDLEVDQTAAAHSADGDVLVLEKLFDRLEKKLSEKLGEEKALEEMMDISSLPSLMRTFTFGKHAGKNVSDVAKEAPDYLQWLLEQKEKNPADEEDWIYTLRMYLGKLM